MAKKITKWEPEDFELEMTTHWSFPKRGDWATHDAKWRGNWSPYIPRNILLRYSQENDLVLDQFVGGGTTLVEAKLLNRNIIGVDVNDVALTRCKEKTAFEHEGANGKVYLHKGDARNLDFVPDNSIDLICTHPPYADIIQYSEDIPEDLSLLKVKEVDGYGIEKLLPDFQKMKCCDDICNFDVEQLKIIFKNLKTVIDHIIQLLNDNKNKE